MDYKDNVKAKVIAHSQAPNGGELITMEIDFHRFILPEYNTHRVLSKNAQSSRAIPVKDIINQVRTNPAIPVHWGKKRSGMVADEECENLVDLFWLDEDIDPFTNEAAWRRAAEVASDIAESFLEAEYHKQIVNRLLEPFMWTKGVTTAIREGFESMFKLRRAYDAQPEFKLLADRMKDALDNSTPIKLNYGDYHMPYLDTFLLENGERVYGNERLDGVNNRFYYSNLEHAIKVATSCCAQVSYRKLDDSLEKALKIYDMLNLPVNGVYPEGNPHFSPAEHIAKVVPYTISNGGNFGEGQFWQYRKALESGHEDEFLVD